MALHELKDRSNGGLRVTMYWDDADDTLTVEVEDSIVPDGGFTLTGLAPVDANSAFEHPFAYGKAPV